jgi:hypothetical protein
MYDPDSKRLLPYVKVTRYDDQAGYDHSTEYYVPCRPRFSVGVPLEQIIEVAIERRKEGDYPPTSTKLHNYNEV